MESQAKTFTRKVYIYQGFERFWHWSQALLIIFLTFTGFEVHGTFVFFGFDHAVQFHNIAAYLFLGLIVFAIFWHLTTGEWRQYVPTTKMLQAQVRYYITGIFNDEPHPTKKDVLHKLNPLQKMAYLGLKILVIPVQATSGLLYIYYKELSLSGWMPFDLGTIAFVHTLGAFGLIAFVAGHIYLTTTGHTVLANTKAMVTGWEEIEVDEKELSQENYASIVANTEMGYYFLDKDGFIREVNDAWLKMYGYSNADEIVGKHSSTTRRPEDLEALQESLGLVLSGQKLDARVVKRLNKDGSTGEHVLTCNPVYLDQKIVGMAGFIMDVDKSAQKS
ncbi:MAG: cytochrome b/b6 domain-containing protein [Leptospiraceae bacterium]|nr:cytochrome b/b6 domain-containing protein [Leptospiraceae bacterium]